jgi:hypothetical protein
MRRHELRVFQRAAAFKISCDPGRAEGVAANLRRDAEIGGAALYHAVCVHPKAFGFTLYLIPQTAWLASRSAEDGRQRCRRVQRS